MTIGNPLLKRTYPNEEIDMIDESMAEYRADPPSFVPLDSIKHCKEFRFHT
jgi:hypothetical protein